MNSVYLLLGTNLKDRHKNLLLAQYLINRICGRIIQRSSVYLTEPWGNTRQPDYYNQAVVIQTSQGPFRLLNALRKIEKKMGRNIKNQNTARIIDIDILFYGNSQINTRKLVVPHPRLHLRNFTLQPLLQIDQNHIHPVFNKTLAALEKDCADTGKVSILAG